MPRLSTTTTTSKPASTNAVTAVARPRKGAPSEDEIRARAYAIFQARGAQPGREAEDWAQAERELRARAVVTAR
ncbi:MAG TPA: DUF2934 domain-containing protein [Candidatus Thermoplasmatota archaeon]|nr:DUF2934 domain-containing protein [Candidatus Thermoplasmatota archaeon]